MKNLNAAAEDLFNKIRGRFPDVTIGDSEGKITNVPTDARFFDFSFNNEGVDLGKVSVALDEENGVTVVVGKDIVQNQLEDVQDRWFNFLKELRIFAKKRTLNFDVRDINKSNLNKRDYEYLAANRSGEETMAESKMYGTNTTSYQRVGKARLAIKHAAPINVESATGRTQKIKSIYIESPEGERFKYPYKHLSGARAMAVHVNNGGNAYDDFGKYISGLSEEVAKLRKFSQYLNRSSVMAESLAGYTDIVKERVTTVKKEIQNLQKESYYKEAFENFVAQETTEVPDDIAENWIDQLTIKQFNEELKDVFPYIYKLVGEATRAEELDFDGIVAEAEKQKGVDGKACWDGYKRMGTKMKGGKRVDNCVPIKKESIDDMLEAAIDQLMGQFAESENDVAIAWMEKHEPYIEYHIDAANAAHKAGNEEERKNHRELARLHRKAQIQWEMNINDGKAQTMSTKAIQASKAMGADIGEAKGKDYDNDGDVDSDDYMKAKDIAIKKALGISEGHAPDHNMKARMRLQKIMQEAIKDSKKNESIIKKIIKKNQPTKTEETAERFAIINDKNEIEIYDQESDRLIRKVQMPDKESAIRRLESALYEPGEGTFRGKQMWYSNKEPSLRFSKVDKELEEMTSAGAIASVAQPIGKMQRRKKTDEEEKKTPIGEFILSYFDRENGTFPKGETAVLTMVEKDYGDQYVEPAAKFIKKVEAMVAQRQAEEMANTRYPETEMIKSLAGL